MSAPTLKGAGLVRFRLTDIPEKTRYRGLDVALRRTDSFAERVRLGLAAEQPSDRAYWIPRAAWERVMGR